jgi:hypothetical protein
MDLSLLILHMFQIRNNISISDYSHYLEEY